MRLESPNPNEQLVPKAVSPVPDEKDLSVNLFFKIERKFAHILRFALVLFSLSLGLLMAAQVFMRYIIESPFLGMEELAPLFALWVYFLGMAYATRERDHISGGILTLVIRDPLLITVVRILGTIACLSATAIFGFYAYDFFASNLQFNRMSLYMRWPKYFWDISMVLGLGIGNYSAKF